MKLSELFLKVGMICPAEKAQIEIKGITSNSKRVEPGWLFVCLPGTRKDRFGKSIDGERYIDDAVSRGCAAFLSETEFDRENGIFTADPLGDMSRLCRAFYGDGIEKLKLVAVTGTNGKTTTVQLLRSIFTVAGYACGTVGTLGCRSSAGEITVVPADLLSGSTTPDPELLYQILSEMAKQGNEYVFIEASSHALARKKLDALRFECGIFTNITRDHLDFHLNEENYILAKAALSGLCKCFIVNADDPNHKRICERSITCSQNGNGYYTSKNEEYIDHGGSRFELCRKGKRVACIHTHLCGSYNVMNTLEAAACALTFGIDADKVRDGIESLTRVDGRLERVKLSENADVEVYIDYAHTPDALRNLLTSAGRLSGKHGRTVLLFGCGGDRDKGKRREMGRIASAFADFTVITSDNCRSEDPGEIINDILKGTDKEKPYIVIPDRREAIKYAIMEARPGDTVILAGKGHEKYETDAMGTHPFDEAETARRAWEEKWRSHSEKTQ